MHLNDILEARNPLFYHGSKKSFPVGFILKPQPDGYVHGVYGDDHDFQIRKIEKILEKYRPRHLISRYESVFLVTSRHIIDHAGGHSNHIYRVKPIGNCEKSCLYWYSQLESAVLNDEKSNYKLFANNYWNDISPENVSLPIYEYRCREAIIIKILT